MKIRDGYVLRNINGSTFLLPYGQAIADHKHSILLNESGILLWNALRHETEVTELLRLLTTHYEASEDELPVLENDLYQFLDQLISLDLLVFSDSECTVRHYYKIGTLTLGYAGPAVLIHPALKDFECRQTHPNQLLTILPHAPKHRENGSILVRTKELTICSNKDFYLFICNNTDGLQEFRVKKDGSHAYFYCIPPFNQSVAEQLFHAFRFTYLVLAQKHGLFALHSASVLYKEKAWLFSGSSGTGKSTHATLWQELFHTPLLNGDLNLIGIENNVPVLYGIPWCGTSKTYTTKKYTLGGITFLKQHSTNLASALTPSEKELLLAQRLISPTWTAELLDLNLDFVHQLLPRIYVYRLMCTKEPSSAHFMKQLIDENYL